MAWTNSAEYVAKLAELDAKIAAEFVRVMDQVAGRISLAEIERLIDAGDLAGLIDALSVTDADLWPLREAVRSAYVQAPATLPAGLTGLFRFDGGSRRVVEQLAAQDLSLIQYITEGQAESVRSVLSDGAGRGASSRRVALDLVGRYDGRRRVGGIIGLNVPLTDSLIRSRGLLVSGQPDELRAYLALKLRDRRFDKTIDKAIRTGDGLTAEQIDRILDHHKSKALKYRGQLVAQNEAHKAMAAGRFEQMRQIKDDPRVEVVEKRWQHNLSVDPRPDHLAMNGTVVDIDEPFQFTDADMMHPHDPVGGVKHSAFCRCTAEYRVRFKLNG